MSIRTLLTAFFLFVFVAGYAQETPEGESAPAAETTEATDNSEKEPKVKKPKPPYYHHKLPSIQINGGNLSLMSDDMNIDWPYSGTNWRWAYGAKIEYRPLNYLGVAISGMMGKVANQQRTAPSTTGNYTVETEIVSAEFNLIIPLDNNVIINRASKFAPYLFGGVAYQWFSPRADKFSADGRVYNFWRTGEIYDRPENREQPELADLLF